MNISRYLVRISLVFQSLFLMVGVVAAHPSGNYSGWDGHMMWGPMGRWGGMGSGFFLFRFLWTIIVFIGVVAFIYWIFKGRNAEENAISILREQYARGEIDTEEFEERKRRLEE